MAAASLRIVVLLSTAFSTFAGNHNAPVIGQTFLAGSIDPLAGSTGWALTSHGIAEKLFTVDGNGNIVAQVAKSVKKIDTLTWEVTLKSDYKFSDGTPVTAQHVKTCLTELNTQNKNAQASVGMMVVTVTDDLTVKIKSDRATPVMEAVLAAWVFTVYMKKGNTYIFTGPFAVENFAQGEIHLMPNPHYPRSAERPKKLVIKKYAGGSELATALESGNVEMAFHLPIASLPKLRATTGVSIKTFTVGYHYMAFYNMRKPYLSDVNVRKALDIALDRQALTQVLSGGEATRSFFPRGTPYYRTDAQLNANKAEAERLLDAAGWTKNADGKRMKDGVALTLKLVAYPQRPGLVTMQPAIKAQFEALGIPVTTKITSGSSWDELDGITANKDFDMLFWAQHTLPAGDPQWFINAFFRKGAGNNFAGLASDAIDAKIDALSLAASGADRVAATLDVHNAILEQVPVSMLMTPAWHVGVRGRMSEYVPWGADYYIIHAGYGIPERGSTAPVSSVSDKQTSGASRVVLSALSVASLFCLALMF